MSVPVEMVDLLLYALQQLGIILGVGSEVILLVLYVFAIADHDIDAKEIAFTTATKRFLMLGLLSIVLSGIGITIRHALFGETNIVFEPAYVLKWILICLAFAMVRFGGQLALRKGIRTGLGGAVWIALLIVHIVAPVTTWGWLIGLSALWLMLFMSVWSGIVYAIGGRETILPPARPKPPQPQPEPTLPVEPPSIPQPTPVPVHVPVKEEEGEVIDKPVVILEPEPEPAPAPEPPEPEIPMPELLSEPEIPLELEAAPAYLEIVEPTEHPTSHSAPIPPVAISEPPPAPPTQPPPKQDAAPIAFSTGLDDEAFPYKQTVVDQTEVLHPHLTEQHEESKKHVLPAPPPPTDTTPPKPQFASISESDVTEHLPAIRVMPKSPEDLESQHRGPIVKFG